jgi:hypothetical protein
MESRESTTQTLFAEAPHGTSTTGVPLAAVLAVPMHRLVPAPFGVYSNSNAQLCE